MGGVHPARRNVSCECEASERGSRGCDAIVAQRSSRVLDSIQATSRCQAQSGILSKEAYLCIGSVAKNLASASAGVKLRGIDAQMVQEEDFLELHGRRAQDLFVGGRGWRCASWVMVSSRIPTRSYRYRSVGVRSHST